MSKSSGRSLFGTPRPGAVTLVETPVSRTYARKARLTFYVVAAVVALVSAVAWSHHYPPVVGLILGVLLGAVVGFVAGAVVLAWPVLRVLWHWAAEISLGVGLVFGWTALMDATGLYVSLLIVTLAVGVPAGIGPVRRWVVAWVWCAIVRHRLRLCFAQFIRTTSKTHTGSAPLILIARPTPAGERVWVWLRAGLDLGDLEGKTPKLAVGCWADQVRVTRTGSKAALIRIDIAHRDPLRVRISSPLLNLIPKREQDDDTPVSPGIPPVGLDLPDVPDDTPAPGPASRVRKPRTAPVIPPPAPAGDDDAFI
jgi:hypothetical protein